MVSSIYLEAEDEITAAISRIREVTETDAVLVLSRSSRIGTSRINFKLLAREANARGINLVAVSDEQTVRALAVSAGLPAYGTLAEASEALGRTRRHGAQRDERTGRLPGETAARRAASERPTAPRPAGTAAALASPTRVLPRINLPADEPRAVPPADVPVGAPVGERSGPTDSRGGAADTHGGAADDAGARRRARDSSRRLPILPLLLVALLGLALAGGLYAAYLYLPTATVTLQLAPQSVATLDVELVADPSVAVPDAAAGVIPAERIQLALQVNGTFPATGVQVTRTPASGTVRLESRNTVFDVTVQAQTRLSTSDGVEFVTTETVTIGRADFDTGRPTRVEVDVEAVSEGPAGNVPRNSITQLPDDLAAAQISVTNPRAMSGGRRIEQAAVTQEDYDAALAQLGGALDDELQARLADPATTPRGLTLYPATATRDEPQASPPASELVDSEVEEFELSLTVTATVLAVNEALVEQLAAERLRESLPAGIALVGNDIEVNHEAGRTNGTTITYLASTQAATYSEPEREALLDDIRGKTVSEAEAILEQYGEAEIDIWPDIVDRLPQQAARISLTILPPREAQ